MRQALAAETKPFIFYQTGMNFLSGTYNKTVMKIFTVILLSNAHTRQPQLQAWQTPYGNLQVLLLNPTQKKRQQRKNAAALKHLNYFVPPAGSPYGNLPGVYPVLPFLQQAFLATLLKSPSLKNREVYIPQGFPLLKEPLLQLASKVRRLYFLGVPPANLNRALLQHCGTPLVPCAISPPNALNGAALLNPALQSPLTLKALTKNLPKTQQFLTGLLPEFNAAEPLPLAAAVYLEWRLQGALKALCEDLAEPLEQWLTPKAFYFSDV